jgi:hypothetical protein
MRRRALAAPFAAALLLAAACSVKVAPVVAADPEASCPAGSAEWHLEIVDQRADKKPVTDAATPIRDSIVRSLPGCRWTNGAAPTITIEVHRLHVDLEDYWEAAAEWSVIVRDREGRTVTEFQAESHVSRPNYRGVDNEKASMQEALDEAMRRTLAGLRSVSLAR